MTSEQVENLKLGILPINDRLILIIESAFEWINSNTTLNVDYNNDDDVSKLPPCAKLFICGFVDIATLNVGVSSESIEGLSQSFNTNDKSALIWDIANLYLGDYLNNVRFVEAKKRWY